MWFRMPSIRPIPKRLLIHSVQYKEYLGNPDGFGDSWADPVTIDFVRVEPATSFNRNANGEVIQAQHILFLDRLNSSSFPKMKEKSKVTFNGRDWIVNKVKPLYAFNYIHHYENELI